MKSIRTFIALELTPHVRSRAGSLQESLARSGTSLKWAEEENMHLTLLFLGDLDAKELVEVCRAVQDEAAEMSPFQISVETVGCFPTARRPRVVWIGIGEGSEEVHALHDALETSLMQLGCYRREDRKYTPHVTLGRIKGKEPLGDLTEVIHQKANWKAGEVAIREVVVFSSELSSQGPIYSVLARAKLGG